MVSVLIDTLEYQLIACRNAKSKEEQRLIAERAFGAAQYHILLFPSSQNKVGSLWETYKLRFEEIISKNNT